MLNHLKKCVKIISYLCLFILITGLIVYFAKDIFTLFQKVNPALLGLCILLQIPTIAFGGYAFKILCTALGLHLRWQEWAGLSFIANFLNQLLPYRPGVGFRYLYMRQHYHMKTADYVHIMFIYLLLTLFVSSIFTLVGWFRADLPNSFNIMILSAVGLIIGIVSFILVLKRFLVLAQALLILLNKPAVLIGTTLSLVCVNAITAVIFYLLFKSTGSSLPLADCFFLVGIIVLSMIVPVTPGNIGVLETIVGTLTQMLYHDFSLGFGATALFRASQWLPSVVLGTGFSLLLVGSFFPKLTGFKFGVRHSVD